MQNNVKHTRLNLSIIKSLTHSLSLHLYEFSAMLMQTQKCNEDGKWEVSFKKEDILSLIPDDEKRDFICENKLVESTDAMSILEFIQRSEIKDLILEHMLSESSRELMPHGIVLSYQIADIPSVVLIFEQSCS